MKKTRSLIMAVSASLLFISFGTSAMAATWSGGTGNWIDDSWGLSGGAPGDGTYTAEDATISGNSDVVTVQAANSFSTSGQLIMDGNSQLIVEGDLTFDTGRGSGAGGNITVQGSGELTMPKFHFFWGVTIKDSAVVNVPELSGSSATQFGGTAYINNLQHGASYSLSGGTVNSTSFRNGWAGMSITVDGGSWNESGSFDFYRGGAADVNILSGSMSVTDDLLFAEEWSDKWNTGAKSITVSDGTLSVGGDLSFWADSQGGNQSDCTFSIIGSSGSITMGGITTGGTGTGLAVWSFEFTPDATGVTPVTLISSVPDFSKLLLTLNDSDAYPGSGDVGMLFAIPGTSTLATPFSNAGEGDVLTFDDEGTTIYMTITYAGGDGNDIVLTETSVSNNAPVADDSSTNTVEDVAVEIIVTAADDDPGDTLTFSEETTPAHGSLSAFTAIDSRSAKVTYTPDLNYNGPDSFEFSVTDGVDSDIGLVSVTITPAQDAPDADDVSVTTFEDQAVLVTLSGSDPDGESLSYSVDSAPTNGTITVLDDEYMIYTPNSSYTGGDSFTYVVSDGITDSDPATVTVSVLDPAIAEDWQTDRWSLTSGKPWPGSSTESTTEARVNNPDVVALTDQGGATSGSITWTDGGRVLGDTGIAIIGDNGVMNFNGPNNGLAVDFTNFTTVLSDNGIINYNGIWFGLGGHLRLNDSCMFTNSNNGISFRLKTVTLNGGVYTASQHIEDEETVWVLNGGAIELNNGAARLGRDSRYYFVSGSIQVAQELALDRANNGKTAKAAIIGTGMGAPGADSSGLQVDGDFRIGSWNTANQLATAAFIFDDSAGVDYWSVGGNLEFRADQSSLEVNLGSYDMGRGNKGVLLFDYSGNLAGDQAFHSVSVTSDAGDLTPGTLGSLEVNEYAIDYGSGTGDTIKIYARLQGLAGTLILVQ